ncbi:hypothetical protein ABEF95_005948 [Exophiala dermatitidis]
MEAPTGGKRRRSDANESANDRNPPTTAPTSSCTEQTAATMEGAVDFNDPSWVMNSPMYGGDTFYETEVNDPFQSMFNPPYVPVETSNATNAADNNAPENEEPENNGLDMSMFMFDPNNELGLFNAFDGIDADAFARLLHGTNSEAEPQTVDTNDNTNADAGLESLVNDQVGLGNSNEDNSKSSPPSVSSPQGNLNDTVPETTVGSSSTSTSAGALCSAPSFAENTSTAAAVDSQSSLTGADNSGDISSSVTEHLNKSPNTANNLDSSSVNTGNGAVNGAVGSDPSASTASSPLFPPDGSAVREPTPPNFDISDELTPNPYWDSPPQDTQETSLSTTSTSSEGPKEYQFVPYNPHQETTARDATTEPKAKRQPKAGSISPASGSVQSYISAHLSAAQTPANSNNSGSPLHPASAPGRLQHDNVHHPVAESQTPPGSTGNIRHRLAGEATPTSVGGLTNGVHGTPSTHSTNNAVNAAGGVHGTPSTHSTNNVINAAGGYAANNVVNPPATQATNSAVNPPAVAAQATNNVIHMSTAGQGPPYPPPWTGIPGMAMQVTGESPFSLPTDSSPTPTMKGKKRCASESPEGLPPAKRIERETENAEEDGRVVKIVKVGKDELGPPTILKHVTSEDRQKMYYAAPEYNLDKTTAHFTTKPPGDYKWLERIYGDPEAPPSRMSQITGYEFPVPQVSGMMAPYTDQQANAEWLEEMKLKAEKLKKEKTDFVQPYGLIQQQRAAQAQAQAAAQAQVQTPANNGYAAAATVAAQAQVQGPVSPQVQAPGNNGYAAASAASVAGTPAQTSQGEGRKRKRADSHVQDNALVQKPNHVQPMAQGPMQAQAYGPIHGQQQFYPPQNYAAAQPHGGHLGTPAPLEAGGYPQLAQQVHGQTYAPVQANGAMPPQNYVQLADGTWLPVQAYAQTPAGQGQAHVSNNGQQHGFVQGHGQHYIDTNGQAVQDHEAQQAHAAQMQAQAYAQQQQMIAHATATRQGQRSNTETAATSVPPTPAASGRVGNKGQIQKQNRARKPRITKAQKEQQQKDAQARASAAQVQVQFGRAGGAPVQIDEAQDQARAYAALAQGNPAYAAAHARAQAQQAMNANNVQAYGHAQNQAQVHPGANGHFAPQGQHAAAAAAPAEVIVISDSDDDEQAPPPAKRQRKASTARNQAAMATNEQLPRFQAPYMADLFEKAQIDINSNINNGISAPAVGLGLDLGAVDPRLGNQHMAMQSHANQHMNMNMMSNANLTNNNVDPSLQMASTAAGENQNGSVNASVMNGHNYGNPPASLKEQRQAYKGANMNNVGQNVIAQTNVNMDGRGLSSANGGNSDTNYQANVNNLNNFNQGGLNALNENNVGEIVGVSTAINANGTVDSNVNNSVTELTTETQAQAGQAQAGQAQAGQAQAGQAQAGQAQAGQAQAGQAQAAQPAMANDPNLDIDFSNWINYDPEDSNECGSNTESNANADTSSASNSQDTSSQSQASKETDLTSNLNQEEAGPSSSTEAETAQQAQASTGGFDVNEELDFDNPGADFTFDPAFDFDLDITKPVDWDKEFGGY